MPVVENFWEEFVLFVNGNETSKYPSLPIKKQLGQSYDSWVLNHKTQINNFNDFLNKAGVL